MSAVPLKNDTNIKTYVFFDLETTGFIQSTSMPRITEMSLVASSRDSIFLTRKKDTLPRVTHKLTIPLQPMRLIPIQVSKLTGLYNDLLEQEQPFNEETYVLLNAFICRLCPPICFVAHNGNRFDYPILLSELNRIGKSFTDDILCIDSLVAFQALLKPTHSIDVRHSVKPETVNLDASLLDDGCDAAALAAVVDLYGSVDETGEKLTQAQQMQIANETTPTRQVYSAIDERIHKPFNETDGSVVKKALPFSRDSPANFKLETVYTYLVGGAPLNSHSAEGDCLSLLACVMKIGDPFARWADINASPMTRYAQKLK